MIDLKNNRFYHLFERQRKNQFNTSVTSYKARIKKLNTLKKALEITYKEELRAALYADFKKPYIETDLTELYLVIKEIKFARSQLRSWISKKRVKTPLTLMGTSSWIIHEPKGVCLIISPWNYPINLTFSPLVSAISAGNMVIIKPSELTPHTSKVMARIVNDLFNEDEVALVEGAVEESQELLQLPFNHIFFTGSPKVGKIVMKAAATHLASVTLELGGKSPTIIDKNANLNEAIKSIVWGKYLNNGQTCIAPDYVFVHESIKEQFYKVFREKVRSYYTEAPVESESYARIVNERHFDRLISYLHDAQKKGATIISGGKYDADERYIEPTLVGDLPDYVSLFDEEIFGPILPLRTFDNVDEVIDFINSKEKPLALYIYSRNKKMIQSVISNTRAGTSCINTNAIQYSNHHLPFGGSNNSGIGKSHGYFGFQEFSNQRAILKRNMIGPLYLLLPPYNNFKQRLVDLTIKWF